MNGVRVGRKTVSDASPTYLIAEIGINHNGDIEIAKKLIDESVKAGFDAVKFQTFIPEQMTHSKTKLAEYQKKTKFKNSHALIF